MAVASYSKMTLINKAALLSHALLSALGASNEDLGFKLATLLSVSALTANAENRLTRSWSRLLISSSQSLRTWGAEPR